MHRGTLRFALVAALSVPALAIACSSFSSDEVEGALDGGDDAPASDAADVTPKDASLPKDAGPPDGMVAVKGYFIDKYETTNAEYGEFTNAVAKGTATLDLPAVCASKTSFDPKQPSCRGSNYELQALPITCVDWCDAYAYCKYRGKRLCGAIGGGPSNPTVLASGQWSNACSPGGTNLFPYGATEDNQACNTQSREGGAGIFGPEAVGSFPRCEGGVKGLFDMAGNVWEWEDACLAGDGGAKDPDAATDAATDPADDLCVTRGGDFLNYAYRSTCTASEMHPRIGFYFDNTGVRCCSDP